MLKKISRSLDLLTDYVSDQFVLHHYLQGLFSRAFHHAVSAQEMQRASPCTICRGLVHTWYRPLHLSLFSLISFLLIHSSMLCMAHWRQVCSHVYRPHLSLVSSTDFMRVQPLMNILNGMSSRQTPEPYPVTDLQVEYDSATITLCAQKTQSFHPSSSLTIQTTVF